MNYQGRLVTNFTKPLVVGILTYFLSMVVFPNSRYNVRLPFSVGTVSFATYMGLLGSVSSFGTQTVSNWILPYIPGNSSYANVEQALLEPGVNGALNVLVTYMLYPGLYNDIGALKLFGTGLGAELGGDYIYKNFVLPYVG